MPVPTASVQASTTELAQQTDSHQTLVTQENSEKNRENAVAITTTPASDYIPPQTPPVDSGELLLYTKIVINPRRACAARVTVVVLCVCE